jgi:serine/threonine protein kinase/Tol biopolymer transport system component
MALTSGTRLGPYEILSPIGAGGMGEVYRAKDTRLDRIVAIKVVLGHASGNPEFRERFDREARAISSLDHPHICTLHDVGHEGDIDFLVMQYLEGETLADRLTRGPSLPATATATATGSVTTMSRGPLSLDVTLRYAAEIASALDAAHRRGIIHRDLKPGNVMLTKSGTRLLDFGLAKLAEQSPVGGFGDMATRTSPFGAAQGGPLTGQGALLGTLHYMSPEQLEGREVDSRSDIFAFGAVLFEMLSGRRAFDPSSASGQSGSPAGVIAAIIGADPPPLGDLADMKTRVPLVAQSALDRLLRKCLAKNPDDRWQSAADLSDELTWINEERLRAAVPADLPAGATSAAPAASPGRERLWMGVAGAAVAAAIAVSVWLYPRPVPPPEPISFFVDAPDGTAFANGAGVLSISPDGQSIAFSTGDQADRKLWVRRLGWLTASPLAGSEGGFNAVWSPNGRSLAFTGGNPSSLKRIDIAGGPAKTLAEQGLERPAWSQHGVILYAGPRNDGRLFTVPELGGPSTAVTQLDKEREETTHSWPVFLPDGRRFVFLARSTDPAKTALYLGSLDSLARTHLLDVTSMPEVVPGFLLYHRDGTLTAHPFDAEAGRLTGDPMPVLEDVVFNATNGRAAFAVSPTGVLVYRTGTALRGVSVLTWLDATGKELGRLGDPAVFRRGALSPDGRRFVAEQFGTEATRNRTDLIMLDVERGGVSTRFTTDAADERYPVWTPDNATVVFGSNRKGVYDLYAKGAGATVPERVLFESPEPTTPSGFSSDGKTLLFVRGTPPAMRLWALSMTGDPTPVQVFPGSSDTEGGGQFSPDDRWIAYVVSESQTDGNVFVQRYPSNGIKTRISTTTGFSPKWTTDGKRIVYQTADNVFMSVAVSPDGDQMRAELPKPLFTMRQSNENRTSQFAMDGRGERFLLVMNPNHLVTAAEASEAPIPLTVIVNWAQSLLKK